MNWIYSSVMPVGIILIVSALKALVLYSSSEGDESCSRQDTLGCVRNNNSCQITVIEVGWYSQKVWSLSSWRAGHSRMICALSSFAAEQSLHWGSTDGSTFDRWYLKKLWPDRCLMQRPRSVRLNLKSSFESFRFGSGKNFFVCRQVSERFHLAFHFSVVSCRAINLISQVGRGRKGPGPST